MARAICQKIFDSYKDFYINTLPGTVLGEALDGFVFRGHSKEEYKLLPVALRRGSNFEKMVKVYLSKYGFYSLNFNLEYDQMIGESILLREFYRYANYQGLHLPQLSCFLSIGKRKGELPEALEEVITTCKTWPPKEFWPLIALAQHYGVPTRFLDWTFDKNIAAYFAINGTFRQDVNEKNKYIIIWAINGQQLSISGSNLKFIVPTYYNNPNINAQRGILSCITRDVSDITKRKKVQKISKRSLEEIFNVDYACSNAFLYKFIISTANIKEDFKFLIELGYSANRLFPGYGGAYKAMEDYMNFYNFIEM